jgi:hypothetical protein
MKIELSLEDVRLLISGLNYMEYEVTDTKVIDNCWKLLSRLEDEVIKAQDLEEHIKGCKTCSTNSFGYCGEAMKILNNER